MIFLKMFSQNQILLNWFHQNPKKHEGISHHVKFSESLFAKCFQNHKIWNRDLLKGNQNFHLYSFFYVETPCMAVWILLPIHSFLSISSSVLLAIATSHFYLPGNAPTWQLAVSQCNAVLPKKSHFWLIGLMIPSLQIISLLLIEK